jgi:CBS domain-containing protein
VVGVISSRDISNALSAATADASTLRVGDAMAPDPYVCSSRTPLSEVARSMEAHRYGCVVVHDGNHLAGVFTTIDALRALRAVTSGAPVRRQITPHHLQETDPDDETRGRWRHISRIRARRDRNLPNFRGPRSMLWRIS